MRLRFSGIRAWELELEPQFEAGGKPETLETS
jgi:hypothetical protein